MPSNCTLFPVQLLGGTHFYLIHYTDLIAAMPLTSAEENQFALQFLLLDHDSDGCLPIAELGRFLRSVGYYPTTADLRSLTGIVDPEGTGVVTRERLLSAAESLAPLKIPDVEVREAFKVLDEDQDGYLTAAQLRHILTNLGAQLTNEEADELLRDAPMDSDTQINIDDLVTMLLKVKPLC